MKKLKLTKCEYERYLTDRGFPKKLLNELRIRKTTSYGSWMRLHQKEEFDKGYSIWYNKRIKNG